jgi:hypothetical protein
MTSKEFKEVTGAKLIEVAEDYQGYEDAIEERKEEIADELAENLCWDDMELVIYSDWYSDIREHRQTGENEGMVVEKIGLSEYLWRDVLYDWGIEDWETADDKVKEQFKVEVLYPIIEEI